MNELYPRLRDLTLLAHQYDIGINIDAEEADRLELSLDLLERLCHESRGLRPVGTALALSYKPIKSVRLM